MSEISEQSYAMMKCMLRGTGELSEAFSCFARCASSPQIRDEFEKLTASSLNHKNLILKQLGEINENK